MKTNFDRIPPHSIEAEQSVLGSILVEDKCLERIIDFLPDENFFYKDTHRIIYRHIIKLYKEKIGIDIITVAEELDNKNQLEKIGGTVYLSGLSDVITSTVNIQDYAKIVRDKALERQLINVSNEILNLSYNEEYSAEELLQVAEAKIFDLANQQLRQGYLPISDILEPLLIKLEDLYKRKKDVTGIQTHFKKLDAMTSGFQPSDFIVLAARPGMGKTSLALNIAYNVAKYKKSVAIFSLEMSDEQICFRLLSSASRINLKKLRIGNLSQTEWKKLILSIDEFSDLPLFVVDRPGISMIEIQSIARRLKKEQDIQMIIIDYLQLISTHYKGENRQQEMSLISRLMKSLARELNIPVIALSQLNRSVETRKPPIPLLSDLRESGAIEQDADLVLFIYRDEYYYDDSPDKGKARIMIEKHRNGPTGSIDLAFLGDITTFGNLADEYEE